MDLSHVVAYALIAKSKGETMLYWTAIHIP